MKIIVSKRPVLYGVLFYLMNSQRPEDIWFVIIWNRDKMQIPTSEASK